MTIRRTSHHVAGTTKTTVLIAVGVLVAVSVTLWTRCPQGAGVPSFFAHVSDIVTPSPKKEVRRINATAVVAFMQNAQFSALVVAGKFPRNLVSLSWFSKEAELPVSVGIKRCHPVPTPIRLFNLGPKAFFDSHREIIPC